jgi:hypothetical protein
MADLASLFAGLEQQYGLPSGYMMRTAQIESSLNPRAKNPRSSAGGLFQFLDGTARQYGLRDKFDPVQASQAAARLARDNQNFLARRLGRQPTAAELYLAHQQGPEGARRLLSNPNARVGGAEVTLNGGQSGQTAGAFASQWINKFNRGGGGGAQGQRVAQGQQGGVAALFAPQGEQTQPQRRGFVMPQRRAAPPAPVQPQPAQPQVAQVMIGEMPVLDMPELPTMGLPAGFRIVGR